MLKTSAQPDFGNRRARERWWRGAPVWVGLAGLVLVLAWSGNGLVAAPFQEQEHPEPVGEEKHAGPHAAGDDHAAGDHHGEFNLMEHFLGKDHLIGHTADKPWLIRFPSFTNHNGEVTPFGHEDNGFTIGIPQISPWSEEQPLMEQPEGEAGQFLGPITFQPTRFVILQLLAALLVGGTFVWLGRKIQTGQAPTGKCWNMLEAVVIYIRDEVAKPAIGSHDYKYFLPFLWTVFFFILTMNLMGMFPLLGTPTGNISVTTALALCVFAVVLFTGMKKLGVIGFWKAQAPHMDLPGAMKAPMTIGIWCIEVFGLFIKHMVLAVRLFANMFAGHLVLAVFVGFIAVMWGQSLNWVVAPAAIGGSVAISLLEVLVAFIQAYVFTFLTALFIGAAVHPH